MLQRDRKHPQSVAKWINPVKAETAKLNICGPQVCARGNACEALTQAGLWEGIRVGQRM